MALAGAWIFLAVALVQGAVRPEFDAWQQSISALSLGPGGWVQQANFMALGVVLSTTVPVWWRVLAGGTGGTAYPVLTALTAVSLVLLGLVPQDPAPGYDPEGLRLDGPTTRGLMHLAVAGVWAGCSAAAVFVMARRFAGDVHWRGWAAYSRAMGVLMIGCVAVYAVRSTEPTGVAGALERAAGIVTTMWGTTVVWRLWRGAPLMVVRAGGIVKAAAAEFE